ncbi:hypothetical protein ON010_g9429 [Phytophthora cinnamomi]|nr:hypothetical protein ON010_g9429 [Phytophthora cinnamomi]
MVDCSDGSDTQSGEYIAELNLDIAHEVDCSRKTWFCYGCFDRNAKAMVAAWKILEKNGISCTGCRAHTLNLLLEDVAKLLPVKTLVHKVTRIAVFFLTRPKLLARFEEERAVIFQRHSDSAFNNTLSLPTATRCTKKDYEVVEGFLLDDDFWKNGRFVLKLLGPKIKKIGLLEANSSSAGMVYWCFADLLKKPVYCQPSFMSDTAATIMKLIVERWNFVHTDAMAVAFFDPTKDPNDFVDDAKAIALEHIKDIGARMGYDKAKQVLAYQEASRFVNQKLDRRLEGRQMEGHDMASLDWWGYYRDKYPKLFDIARRVFTMPTSSAAAERS